MAKYVDKLSILVRKNECHEISTNIVLFFLATSSNVNQHTQQCSEKSEMKVEFLKNFLLTWLKKIHLKENERRQVRELLSILVKEFKTIGYRVGESERTQKSHAHSTKNGAQYLIQES